ncbi:hypothetical protein, partial [Propionivibrio sp.]|uniref:hypothetical protein n=1 Tax=Propionivibrio sp. TaxID=2212460 RepID=UPI002610257D
LLAFDLNAHIKDTRRRAIVISSLATYLFQNVRNAQANRLARAVACVVFPGRGVSVLIITKKGFQ